MVFGQTESLISNLSPLFRILLVVAAVAGLVACLIYLYNNNETVRNGLNAAWEFLKTAATNIFNAIKSFWEKWGADIIGFLKKNWEITKTVFKTVFEAISQIVKKVFDDIKAFWDKWGPTITEMNTLKY
ncbi:hypothetical protein C7121_26995 [Paenibacillus glucanolyticus]|uniref:hypothetical protein n=1 Tax=Paenibacillus TaxID=44249 RepID=UPI0005663C6B|nr:MULTISPECIES: hypothetical protein [Paenibacillus]ANA81750.1 hypothetical protein A3958_18045 [Paenibacillus glucanolyticus]AVV59517.1 hypothetical protein C7121_26995 [Paenibacillus glucanolyticus]MPY20586.1 hypothetical protein [Paenibacillus glucanolyticus]